MPAAAVRRSGPITAEALAIAALQAGGQAALTVAVGSAEQQTTVSRILSPSGGALDRMRASLPRIELDPALPAETWELRPA